MSKKLSFIFTALLLSALPVYLAADEEATSYTNKFEPFTGKVVGNKVRIRVQPTLEGHVVRETTLGEMVAVTGEESGFFHIAPPKGTKGYVFRTFILDGVVEGERVNIRLYPDIDAPIIGRLNIGDRVNTAVSDVNSKWLEIDLPQSSHFYIAREYIENKGPIELLAAFEKKYHQATHRLSSALLFAQSEIQKPFVQMDQDGIRSMFEKLIQDYADLPDITSRANEAHSLIQDICVQKKIAFLEGGVESVQIARHLTPSQVGRLAEFGIDWQPQHHQAKEYGEVAKNVSDKIGLSSPTTFAEITDKMLVWQPLEESFFHLWAASNGESSIDDFYKTEESKAAVLTGIVEPYNRPVKNSPGDFILRSETLPVAFLYSTQVNLQNLVGKKVTVVGAPRPNNHFAFPAYFVLSVE